MHCYLKSEKSLWTVGYYTPEGRWESESDFNSQEKAAERVHWLNGGGNNSIIARLDDMEKEIARIGKTATKAANEASCLANGTQPD